MSEQAIASAAAQIAAPVVSALLEDLHAAASAEITRLEASMPLRIGAAEKDVQDHVADLHATLHRLVARIEGARANVTTATTPGPTAAETGTSTATSAPTTSTTTQATGPQAATGKAQA